MKRRDLNSSETIAFLRSILSSQRCVPFIGTGFTAKEKAANKLVPNGKEWLEIMAEQINASPITVKPTAEEVKNFSFQELSDVYFREKIVDFEKIKNTLNDCFSKVRIESEAKKAFLSIPWRYIYTLNIDDAIENHIDGVKVVPYEPFEIHDARPFVYKMHGDVWTALKAADADGLKLIFGRGDYIRGLKKNDHLIQCLSNDFAERNILFIGCSLSDELDVLYALASEIASPETSGVSRVYVTSSYPEDWTTQKKLRDYGITDIIVCDYNEFYLKLKELSLEIEEKAPSSDRFIYSLQKKDFSKNRFLRYFLQTGWKNESPDSLCVDRDVENELDLKLSRYPVVVIRGRRFTGKTTLLHRVLEKNNGKKKLFIPTSHTVDDRLFNELLTLENTFVVVDSGAMPFQHLRTLSRRREEFRDVNTNFLVATSGGDMGAFYGLPNDAILEVRDKFYTKESEKINHLFGKIGLKKWRAASKILDNIFYVAESPIAIRELGETSSLQTRLDWRVKDFPKSSDLRIEFSILYILSVRQNLFSAVYRKILSESGFVKTADAYITDFAKNWGPFVELIDSDAASDREHRSTRQLIVNSSVWLHYATRRLAKTIGLERTAQYVCYAFLVSREWDDEAHELTMFDQLNTVFGPLPPFEANWSAALIREVYLGLAAYLYQEPNYWLQRAKSVYNISNDILELKEAIAFCDKAISEIDEKVTVNSKLTRANLYGKICRIMEYKDEQMVIQAIKIYYEALQDYDQNSTHINDLLKKSRSGRGDFRLLISGVDKMPKSANFVSVISEFKTISGFLRSV